MTYSTIKLSIADQIAHVQLSRVEKLNAINKEMFYDIIAVIKQLKKDRTIRAVIVSGEGDNFSSGLDVKSVLASTSLAARFLAKLSPWHPNTAQRLNADWRKLPVPVIMAIHGRCWGGGMQIALGADFRIATPDASIAIMEARWGLIPDMGGTVGMREVISQDHAKELAMTGKELTGDEAKAIGLITHVNENPLAAAYELANTIAKQSPDAVAAVKKLYNKSWWSGDGMALARETWYQIKVIFGKNRAIKGYNQTHGEDQQKAFLPRKKW